ncbi:MAG: apolipoprotein N-acyltransferase [Alistipes sp.]|nr:apolipoprotein N-acyltransferase [Alistipes sp.]
MLRKLLYVILSVVLLSLGWLGVSGFTLLVAFVPLLVLSASYSDSTRDFWRMAGWALLAFVLWNVVTVWWIWLATPIGPVAATFFSTFWSIIPFMLFHYVSKRSSKALSYTILVAAWVAAEKLYTDAEVISFPWLSLGNGFSGDIWAVQWYEWTGVMGGSVWVLVANILIYEALKHRSVKHYLGAATAVLLPVVVSLCLYFAHEPSAESVKIAVVQPNVDCYDEKFADNGEWQMENIEALLQQIPRDVEVVALPETALPEHLQDNAPENGWSIEMLQESIDSLYNHAMLITGASTVKYYAPQEPRTATARKAQRGYYYDVYNSAVALNTTSGGNVHHKMRLVIGVETMPTFNLLNGYIDLGGITGQLGRNDKATVFHHEDVAVGPAICYEGLYGDSFARFVREGAEVMTVLSNDGWWGDTAGHKRLFDFCRLRAIECRRAIARSANTGVSGFITSRGDVVERLDWEERGVLIEDVECRRDVTMYVQYGDWVGRMAQLLTFLGVMYYTAYRVRRRNHLVN